MLNTRILLKRSEGGRPPRYCHSLSGGRPPAAATDAAPAPASAPAAAAPSAELLAQLARQVEYYLSDTNLVRDAFFRKAIVAAEDGSPSQRVEIWSDGPQDPELADELWTTEKGFRVVPPHPRTGERE